MCLHAYGSETIKEWIDAADHGRQRLMGQGIEFDQQALPVEKRSRACSGTLKLTYDLFLKFADYFVTVYFVFELAIKMIAEKIY